MTIPARHSDPILNIHLPLIEYPIRYVLFVPPEGYFSLGSSSERNRLERTIGRLTTTLKG